MTDDLICTSGSKVFKRLTALGLTYGKHSRLAWFAQMDAVA